MSKEIELSVFLQEKNGWPLQAPYAPLSILASIDLRLIRCAEKDSNKSHFVRNSIRYKTECFPVKADVNVGGYIRKTSPTEIFYIFMTYKAKSDMISLSWGIF